MRVAKRQLRRIIREAIDIINSETGEVFDFGPEGLPDKAWPDIQHRLGITSKPSDHHDGLEVSSDDFHKLADEVEGKRFKRGRAAEEKRLNPVALLDRLDKWAVDAGSEYTADNPDVDLEGVASDLGASAQWMFEPDEWDALIDYFDYDESALLDYAAGAVVG